MPFCKGSRERTPVAVFRSNCGVLDFGRSRAVKAEPAFGGAACSPLLEKEAGNQLLYGIGEML